MEDVYQQLLDEIKQIDDRIDETIDSNVHLLWVELGTIVELLDDAFEKAFCKMNLRWDFDDIPNSIGKYIKKVRPGLSDGKKVSRIFQENMGGLTTIYGVFGKRNYTAHLNRFRTTKPKNQRRKLKGYITDFQESLEAIRDSEIKLYKLLCEALPTNPSSNLSSRMTRVFWGSMVFSFYQVEQAVEGEKESFFEALFNVTCKVLEQYPGFLIDRAPLTTEVRSFEKKFGEVMRVVEERESIDPAKVAEILFEIDKGLKKPLNKRIKSLPLVQEEKDRLRNQLNVRNDWKLYQSRHVEIKENSKSGLYILKLSGQVLQDGTTFQISEYVLYQRYGNDWKILGKPGHFEDDATDLMEYVEAVYEEVNFSSEQEEKVVLLLDVMPDVASLHSDYPRPLKPVLYDWHQHRCDGHQLARNFLFVAVMVQYHQAFKRRYGCRKRKATIPKQLDPKNQKHILEADIPTTECDVFRNGLRDAFEARFSTKKFLLSPKGQWLNRYFTYNASIIVIDPEELEYKEKVFPATFTGLMTYLGERTRKEGEPQITCILSDVQLAKRASFSNKIRTIGGGNV